MSSYPHPIKAVIFDNDGTILDSIPIYRKANEKLIGQQYPKWFQQTVNGRNDYDVASRIIEHYKLNMTPEEYVSKRLQILEDDLENIELIPGIDEIIRTIKKMDIPMAVATSSNRHTHELKIKKHKDIFDLFNVTVCGDEVKNAKPSPEIFQVASKMLGNFDPKNVLVFEDAFLGIKAASEAGMPSVLNSDENEYMEAEFQKWKCYPTIRIHNYSEFDFNSLKWESPIPK